jgi:peptidoglycan/LPS O-acetylase OafA/YrhL
MTNLERKSEPRPAGIRKSAAYSPELESLRGWAILLVFLFHTISGVTGVATSDMKVSPALSFVTAGHTGVTLFFVLSAYLLSRPFLEQARRGRPVRLGDFFRRRALRIMPLYTAAVCTAVVLCFEKSGVLLDGLRAVFFTTSFSGQSVVISSLMPYSAVWWSLGTEAQFYLVLPLLGLCLGSRTGRACGLAIVVAWAVVYGIVTSDRSLMATEAGLRFSLGLPGRAPAFLSGIAAAWLVSRHGARIADVARKQAWLRNGGSDLLLFCVLWVLGRLLQRVGVLGFARTERYWPSWHLAESALWCLVLVLVVLAPLRARFLISNRVLATLGLLSYSLYMVHVPIVLHVIGFLAAHDVAFQGDWLSEATTLVGIFAICLALSALTYRFIERPFLVRKARIDD